jgi:hypothetical protein
MSKPKQPDPAELIIAALVFGPLLLLSLAWLLVIWALSQG